jgi:PAS domain S-box-containing protein
MKKRGHSQTKRQTILIIDALPENVTSLTEYLGNDYELKMVINSSDAISQAIPPDSVPDLILLNTIMPAMDGYTIFKDFKANALTKNVPILLISSNADSKEQAQGIALGAADYLITPFHRAIVKARVGVYLEINRQRAIIEKTDHRIQKIKHHAKYIASEKKNALIELNQIFGSIGDGICLISKDFKILRINSSFLKICKQKNETVIGKYCYDIFKGTRCHTSQCPLIIISKGENRVEFDLTHKFGKNSRKLYLLTARGYRDSQGNLRGIVKDIRDITDRRQAEQQQLDREKIKVLLEVAGAVCHELIQPMQIISMCAQLILLNKNLNKEYYEKLKMISEQIERMKIITEKLKRITRYETIDYVDGIKIVDLDKASS